MARFRKRPVDIDAVQFLNCMTDGEGSWPTFADGDRPQWLLDALAKPCTDVGAVWPYSVDGEWKLAVTTLEGEITASRNDWIIRGVIGEIYPCKPDVFSQLYDRVTGIITYERGFGPGDGDSHVIEANG